MFRETLIAVSRQEESPVPVNDGDDSPDNATLKLPKNVDFAISMLKAACSQSGSAILNAARFLVVNDDFSKDTPGDKIIDIIKGKYPNCKATNESAWSKVKKTFIICGLEFVKKKPGQQKTTFKLVTIPAIWREAAEKIIKKS